MSIVVHANAETMLDRCREFLSSAPALNYNIIQTATRLCSTNEFYKPPYWFCTAEEQGEVVGAAVYAAPDGLVVSRMPDHHLNDLHDSLIKAIPRPVRVIGDPDTAAPIANRLAEDTGVFPVQSTSWCIGKLEQVVFPEPIAPGNLRCGTNDDEELARCWGAMYAEDRPSFLDVPEFMAKKLHSNELFFWENNVSKSMIAVSDRTDEGARIASAFTAPEYRGRGYGSSAVAMMAHTLLQEGHRFVTLSWRVGDPIGKLYESLGFEYVGMRESYLNEAPC